MKTIIGCPLEKAKAVSISKELWEEMEQLALDNPAEPTPVTWGDKEKFIVATYYKIATCSAIAQMLFKINPDVDWNADKVRGKARRMGLKK